MENKVRRQCPQPTAFEEKDDEPNENRIEVSLPTRLARNHQAKGAQQLTQYLYNSTSTEAQLLDVLPYAKYGRVIDCS